MKHHWLNSIISAVFINLHCLSVLFKGGSQKTSSYCCSNKQISDLYFTKLYFSGIFSFQIMAGASHVDESQFKGLSKYFNSTTSTGRANVSVIHFWLCEYSSLITRIVFKCVMLNIIWLVLLMTRVIPKRNHGKVVWDMKLEKSAHHICCRDISGTRLALPFGLPVSC